MKLRRAPDRELWIPYDARKSSNFLLPEDVCWSYAASRMTFAQFESRILQHFTTNPKARRQKRLIDGSLVVS